MGLAVAVFVVSALALGLGTVAWRLFSRYEIVFTLPVEGDVEIDQPLNVTLEIPLEMTLTEADIDLSRLELPLDTDIFVAGSVELETVIPIATNVKTPMGITLPIKANVPVKVDVPIRQNLHVRERLKLDIDHVHIPVKTKVPVQVDLALRQTFRIATKIDVPIRLRLLLPALRPRAAASEKATQGRDPV